MDYSKVNGHFLDTFIYHPYASISYTFHERHNFIKLSSLTYPMFNQISLELFDLTSSIKTSVRLLGAFLGLTKPGLISVMQVLLSILADIFLQNRSEVQYAMQITYVSSLH